MCIGGEVFLGEIFEVSVSKVSLLVKVFDGKFYQFLSIYLYIFDSHRCSCLV